MPLEEADTLYSMPSTMPSSDDVVTFQRPRARSKPEDIFLHPMQSNVVRADAAAMNLGLGANGNATTRYPREAAAWEAGKGPDVARALLGGTTRGASVGPRKAPFQIGGDADSDSDS